MTLSSYPQEFVYLPADFQLFYGENYLEHAAIWQQVIPYFSICADWETLPCPVDNGTGYYPCVDGSFSFSSFFYYLHYYFYLHLIF